MQYYEYNPVDRIYLEALKIGFENYYSMLAWRVYRMFPVLHRLKTRAQKIKYLQARLDFEEKDICLKAN